MTLRDEFSSPDAFETAASWCVQLVDGPLDQTARKELQSWLDLDPRNAEIFDAVAEGWNSVERHASAPEMLALREAAMSEARRAQRARSSGLVRRRSLIWMGLAASVALFAVSAAVWQSQQPRLYNTGVGERQLVRLADGSTVSLDGDSAVRVRLTSNRRTLWLDRGRARFNVAKDPLRPFSVRADDRMVVALGTSFSVERLGADVRVVLYEGRVSILDKGEAPILPTSGPSTERMLAPNHEMVIGEADSVASAPIVVTDPQKAASWEFGMLTFEAERLASAVERMNRYSDQKLVVTGPAAELRISGVFRSGDNLAFAGGVSEAFPVVASRRGESIHLSRRQDLNP